MTNIEKIQSERLAGEVYRLLAGDGSDAMLTAAVHDILEDVTGCSLPVPMDGSTPIIPTSDIQEAVSLMTAIDRRILTNYLTMLGMSPADLLRTLMANRLHGDPTHGIPSLLGSSLPTISSAILSRKISEPNAIEGISLVHQLCEPASLTELYDSNVGWTMIRSLPNIFPNITKATIGCTEINPTTFTYSHNYLLPKTDVEYHLSNAKKITPKSSGIGYIQSVINGGQSKDVYCLELEEIGNGERFGFVGDGMATADITKKYAIYMPKVRICTGPLFNSYGENQLTCVYKVVLGKIETNNFTPYVVYRTILFTPYLIHFEFGQGTAVNLNLGYWNPSYVLSDNPTGTDLIEEGSTAANNLEQFLSNFKTYIAERLAAFDSNGPTLTLSAAVFSSIWDANGNPQVLGDGLDQLRADIHRIVKTTKHWDVNKAS